jgi:hypothetical protein
MHGPGDLRRIAGFQHGETDVCIRLDIRKMFKDHVTVYKSVANVLLMPHPVGPEYITTIQVMPNGVSLYRRPSPEQLRWRLATINCVASTCGLAWRIGTQFCLTCGEPITWRAIADLMQQLLAGQRAGEVKRRYGLAMPQHASLTDMPNAGLR